MKGPQAKHGQGQKKPEKKKRLSFATEGDSMSAFQVCFHTVIFEKANL